jgi:hypothetical protein
MEEKTATAHSRSRKAIRCEGIMTGFSSKVDGSLSFRGSTPELSVEEKVALMSLQGVLIEMLLYPKDEREVEVVEVKTELEHKTQAQRMRAVIFVLWKHTDQTIPFENFYHLKMEQRIEWLKTKLQPQDERRN